MTVLTRDLKIAVKSLKKITSKNKLTHGNKSSIYQMILDDMNRAKAKSPFKRRKNNRKTITQLPRFSAPLNFVGNEKLVQLWPCSMNELNHTYINALGFNPQYDVLKVKVGNSTYSYQAVPYSVYMTFLNTDSLNLEKYYTYVESTYPCVVM
jgi:hypothetical protein